MIIIDGQTNKVQVRGTAPEIATELIVAIEDIYNMVKDKNHHDAIAFLQMLFCSYSIRQVRCRKT